MNEPDIVLCGAALLLPADSPPAGLPEHLCLQGTDEAALKRHIARRGIRYKDQATRLALAVARHALADAGLQPDAEGHPPDPRCAVLAASCFGNLGTVVRTARHLAVASSAVLSPMDLPNASANVVASSLAIWFRLQGPNLFIASGPTSGLDAMRFGRNLIRSGRCDRALIVASEAAQAETQALFDAAGRGAQAPADAAAALVLESAPALHRRAEARARPRQSLLLPWPAGQNGCAGMDQLHSVAGLVAVLRECHAPDRGSPARVLAVSCP